MKNRKILSAFLAAFLAVTAVSCGDTSSTTDETSTNDNTSQEATETVEDNTKEENEEETEESKDDTKEDSEEETETETESEEETESEDDTETTDDETEETDITDILGETVDFEDYITDVAEVTPPLWKVTDPETGNSIYLMGTVHVLPANFAGYPDDVMEIYKNSDGVAVEYDVNSLVNDMNLLMEYSMAMLYDDGTTIKDHISEETYNKAKDYFESIGIDSLTLNMLDQYKTGYWINQLQAVTLLSIENLSTTGVDSEFLTFAEEDGKEIVNIETLDIQVDTLNAYDDELADYLISSYIDDIDDIDSFAKDYAEVYACWAKGDDESMLELDESDTEDIPEDLLDNYDAYMKVLTDDRNVGMAEKASEFLKNGDNYFFMVGSAHFAGENGVDNLLENMGYTVEEIY